MFRVYILQSKKNCKRYVGYTKKDVFTRLKEHNSGTNQWSRKNGPFDLLHYENFELKSLAVKREKFLKSGRGRQIIKNLFPCSSAGRASGC